METRLEALGVYAEVLSTVVKEHEPTKSVLERFRAQFKTYWDILKTKENGIDIIQVGSSFDELHMTRFQKQTDGKYVFYPDIDFDLDMVYMDYIVDDIQLHETFVENGTTNVDASIKQSTPELPISDESININVKGVPSKSINGNESDSAALPIGKRNATSTTHFGKMVPTKEAGYVKLFVTNTGREMLRKPGCRIGNFVTEDGFLLNTAFSSGVVTEVDDPNIEVIYRRTNHRFTLSGPAITDTHLANVGVSYDFVHAFPCPTWPSCAQGWMNRARTCKWPEETIIKRISKEGCILVPVGSHISTEGTLEWRVSFVKSERLLSKSLSPSQRTCYVVVKLMLKALLSDRSILTSYQMKNIFYYTCEEVGRSEEWTEHNLGRLMIKFLKYIATALHIHRIPHYFLPQNNLIAHCTPDEVQATKKEVENILKNPFNALMMAAWKMEYIDDSSSSDKYRKLEGELKAMLIVYVTFGQLLLELGLLNLDLSFTKDTPMIGKAASFVIGCFRKIVRLNEVTMPHIKAGSGMFTARSVPELLKPYAIVYMQQMKFDSALALFLTAEEADTILVENTFPEMLTNMACLLNIKSQQEPSKVIKGNLEKLAEMYFERALLVLKNSPSLHLGYGNFLLESRRNTVKAAAQFQAAIDVQSPRDDDDALIEIDIPGNQLFKARTSYVPGKLTAYYLLVTCYVQMGESVIARQNAGRFEMFLEECELKHKAVGFQLCSECFKYVGLTEKAALLSQLAVKHDI